MPQPQLDFTGLKSIQNKYYVKDDSRIITRQLINTLAFWYIPVSLVALIVFIFTKSIDVIPAYLCSLIIIAVIVDLNKKKDRNNEEGAWRSFASVNGLKRSKQKTDIPPILELTNRVGWHSEGITIEGAKILVIKLKVENKLRGRHVEKWSSAFYTVAKFELASKLPHIFINNEHNDPYFSLLGSSNLTNIYGVSSLHKQRVDQEVGHINGANTYAEKSHSDTVKTVLAAVNKAWSSKFKPAHDIEIYGKELWLVFNGDHRSESKLPELANLICDTQKLVDSLADVPKLGPTPKMHTDKLWAYKFRQKDQDRNI